MALTSNLLPALLHPSSWPVTVHVLLLVLLAHLAYLRLRQPAFPSRAPKLLVRGGGGPFTGPLGFFTARGSFLHAAARRSHTGNYAFHVGQKQVVGLAGPDGRRTFFENRDLNFPMGYAALFNASPTTTVTTEEGFPAQFNRYLLKLLKKDQLDARAPRLAQDSKLAMEGIVARLGAGSGSGSGSDSKAPGPITIDVFEEIYLLVYQLTMRTVGPDDIADDPATLRRTLAYFEDIESAGTAARIIFPWLPTPAAARLLYSGFRMYRVLDRIVAARRRQPPADRPNDALQFLLDEGEDISFIAQFTIGALFAGLLNSGINAAWLLAFAAGTPEWYAKIRAEVDGVVERKRRQLAGDAGEDARAEVEGLTNAQVLCRLSLAEWEADFPLVDLALRETIRFTITGCGFRANLSGKDVPIGATGEVIPDGAFAVYHFDDLHMNEAHYADPARWDPGRYLPGREEDKKVESGPGYIGWGAGRHPCLGMRFARMEMAVTTAMFFASFDFELVGQDGAPTTTVSATIDRDAHSARKPDTPVRMRLTPRATGKV